MGIWSRAFVEAALTIAASSASAANLTVTYAGTVVSGIDATGVFGRAGASLAGLNYTTVYRFDDNLGDRSTIPPFFDGVIGPLDTGDSDPSLGASLTINGVSFNFNGASLGFQADDPLGGTINSYAADMSQAGAFDTSYVGNSLAASSVPFSLETAFASKGTPAVSGFINGFDIKFRHGSAIGQSAAGTLAPTSVMVTVAAVPEPACWTLTIVGFGVAGFALRVFPISRRLHATS